MIKDTKEKQIGRETTCGKLEVPTEEEVIALRALREIKNRVRDLKKRRSELSSHNGTGKAEDLSAIEREMVDLKMRWEKWEERRKQAARERMILLGHEDPS